ncbi:hypothetical protein LUZ60_007220 [Juncus effusus]|nr:hypothetical protein LUZ60_007220 [Juncus effusus]
MDWAELNPDLLRLIAKKLGDISNFVCFRVVCKNWRLVVRPHDCPPQLPWFLEYHPKWGYYSSYHKFFSLYCKRHYTLDIPEAKEKSISGTANRYFRIHEFLALSLFNPLTKSHFSIPHIENSTVGSLIYIGPYQNPNSNPNKDGDIAIVFFYKRKDGSASVVFWRFVDKWLEKVVEVEVPYTNSVAYFQGRFFVFDWKTVKTRVFDVTTGDEVLVIPLEGIRFDYLIEGCGDLLGVVKKSIRGQWQFEVYRLEDRGRNSRWVKITSGIDDRMLFLDGDRTGRGLCLKASDFEGFRGNCIYFLSLSHEDAYAYNLKRYDLESKETQAIPHHHTFTGAWFVPTLY